MTDEQLGLDLGGVASRDEAPLFAPQAIRADALGIIAQARAAASDGSWDADELKYRRIMFPHLVSWLPDADERAQLCFAFLREADRVEQLLAA